MKKDKKIRILQESIMVFLILAVSLLLAACGLLPNTSSQTKAITVTRDEWKNLFKSFSDYCPYMNVTVTWTCNSSSVHICKYDYDRGYWSFTTDIDTSIGYSYYIMDNGTVQGIRNCYDDGYEYTIDVINNNAIMLYSVDFSNDYDCFSLDARTGAFTASDLKVDVAKSPIGSCSFFYEKVEIIVANNKIQSIKCKEVENGNLYNIEYTFTDWGSTNVRFPEVVAKTLNPAHIEESTPAVTVQTFNPANVEESTPVVTAQPSFSIVYHMNYENCPDVRRTYNSSNISLFKPQREGFDFGGWYYDVECTRLFSSDRISDGLELYAKWIEKESYSLIIVSSVDDSAIMTSRFYKDAFPTLYSSDEIEWIESVGADFWCLYDVDHIPDILKNDINNNYSFAGFYENGQEVKTINENRDYIVQALFYSSELTITMQDQYCFVSYSGDASSIIIPEFYNGIPITGIGLINNSKITSFEVPSFIKRIGAGFWARNLKHLYIPDSVEFIAPFSMDISDDATIYCESIKEKDNWDSQWNYKDCRVIWGYKKEN